MREIKLIELNDVEWVPVKIEPILGETIKLGMFLEEDETEKRLVFERLGKFRFIKE